MDDLDLSFLGNCPVCSAQYVKSRTSVVDKLKEAITLHIDCTQCKSSILVSVHAGLKGLVTTIGMPTDLVKSDLKRLKQSSLITVDDVLDMHTFLEKNESR